MSAGLKSIQRIGSGHIHTTYSVDAGHRWVLQRINIKVFTRPERIAQNIRVVADHLHRHHPDYLFLTPVPSVDNRDMVDDDSYPWRMFRFIDNTYTLDEVSTSQQAFSAAKEFGLLTSNLNALSPHALEPTLDQFHDLIHRWEQLEEAIGNAHADRLDSAWDTIEECMRFRSLVRKYSEVCSPGNLVLRITHNDTKINNILFSSETGRAVCAIDLDTLMPGYFIYDLGDMIRTFVSPVNEEERDTTKIQFRRDIYEALVAGYMESMGKLLTPQEKALIPFGGMMMTYIMGMRMLTDHLNGDVYYHTTYEGQNLVRARNQFALLSMLQQEIGP